MRPWLAALLGLAVLTAPGSVVVSDHPNYGIVAPLPFLIKDPDTWPKGDFLTFVKDLGARAIRVDLFWDEIQPKQSDPPAMDPRLPVAIRAAAADGIHVFASLNRAPAWAAGVNSKGDRCPDCMPSDLAAWQTYVQSVLTEFADLGDQITFGIWNEPDLGEFTPANYAALVIAANNARTAANPTARFGLPETSDGAIAAPAFWLATALSLSSSALQPRDVVTVHWYPGNGLRELPVYMANVLRAAGTHETWLTETGEMKDEEDEQQMTIAAIVDVFNHRPQTQWSKIFIYRLFGGTSDLYSLLRVNTKQEWKGKEAFFTYRRKIRTFVVTLQADNGRFVSAIDDDPVTVSARVAGAGPRETFVLEDLDGGNLLDGDFVTIRAPGGMYFHVGGVNRALTAAAACACTDNELFVVESPAGSTPTSAPVRLKSQLTGRYLSPDMTLFDLHANQPIAGSHETFGMVVR
jgi:hypothetical protein